MGTRLTVGRVDNEPSVRATLEKFSFFDQAITEHGFTEYNRDYRLVAEIYSARRGRGTEHEATYTFLFKGCVEAHYTLNIANGFSMDDIYLELERANDASAPGFIWGVNEADAYPGLTYVGETDRTREWAAKLGVQCTKYSSRQTLTRCASYSMTLPSRLKTDCLTSRRSAVGRPPTKHRRSGRARSIL